MITRPCRTWLLLLTALPASAFGQTTTWSSGSAVAPVTWTRTITSQVTGRTYHISVALPYRYAEVNTSYPVLYALDASAQFGTVVETARYLAAAGDIPHLLVVGIGYPGGTIQTQTFPRFMDLSPWPDSAGLASAARQYAEWGKPEGTGGGDGFLRFIRTELIPLIEKDYRTVPSDRAIYGHSLAGLFSLYALLAGDGTFQRFIIGSPALGWAQRRVFAAESTYAAARDRLPGRVFFSSGALEVGGTRNLQQFLGILGGRNYKDLVWESHTFEGEAHVPVIPATISRGLRSIYHK